MTPPTTPIALFASERTTGHAKGLQGMLAWVDAIRVREVEAILRRKPPYSTTEVLRFARSVHKTPTYASRALWVGCGLASLASLYNPTLVCK
jgi:hypothetical protein